MKKDEILNLIKNTISDQLDSMSQMAVTNHFHNGWDANTLDPAVALSGFPVVQVASASTAPTDTPLNGQFRFQVDTSPAYYLWAYLVYQNSSGVLVGAWKKVQLT